MRKSIHGPQHKRLQSLLRQVRKEAGVTQVEVARRLKPRPAVAVLPAGATGKAIAYCNNQWTKLNAFLLDRRLEIDNNRSERSIKPFVIGRKNWLFANTPKGATASATIYSIVKTAKENGFNPMAYLTYVFEQLPNIDTKDSSALEKLLPTSPDLPGHLRMPIKPSR